MTLPIQTSQIKKQYGAFTAVEGISFAVHPGECVGFLGPNGAGKTTTIRMISGFTPISSGSASIFGIDVSKDPRGAKKLLGICQQEDSLDPDFHVTKNLLVYARYFGISSKVAKERATKLLDFVQLTEKAKSKIDALSGGMKRRLVLARSLINEPKLLILDEPTTGLDPQVRQLIWQKIRSLKKEGVTVLLTTHYMEEASQLCDRVILMDHGKILLEGTPAKLIEQEIGKEVVELSNPTSDVKSFAKSSAWTFEALEDRLFIYDRTDHGVANIIAERFPNTDRFIRRATLEDVFLKRAGRALRE